jgi:starvation-inducible DNA-binding protein
MPITARSRRALPLTADERRVTCSTLQDVLYHLIDLRLGVQQVHWNVQGRHFYGVHKMLDEFYTTLNEWVDTLAERILALGQPADGRPAAVAEHSTLPAAPEGFVQDVEGLRFLLTAYAAFDERLRDAIDALEEPDPSSQDEFVDLSKVSEQHQWMLRAHLA